VIVHYCGVLKNKIVCTTMKSINRGPTFRSYIHNMKTSILIHFIAKNKKSRLGFIPHNGTYILHDSKRKLQKPTPLQHIYKNQPPFSILYTPAEDCTRLSCIQPELNTTYNQFCLISIFIHIFKLIVSYIFIINIYSVLLILICNLYIN
jgi:hypothetical protein